MNCRTTLLVNGQPVGGGGSSPAGPALLYTLPATVLVNNALLNSVVLYTLPANTLAADGAHLIIDVGGNVLQSNVAAQNWSFGLSLNGVVMWFDTSISMATSAQRRTWRLFVDMQRKTSTTVAISGFVSMAVNATVTIAGLGDITLAPAGANAIGTANADPAAAWGSNQLIDVSVQASVAGIEFVTKVGRIYLQTAP